jgi:hypothetical protein
LNQHLKPIKVLGVRFIQSCFYQITLISRTNETREIDGLQKNQKILTGIALVCFENYGRKKPQQAGVFSDKKNYFLASLAAGAAAAGLASFFGSSFLAGAA